MQPVCLEKHADKRWQRYASYSFAAKKHLAPIVAAEVPAAALAMPLVFVPDGDAFVLMAVLSFKAGHNAFVGADGKWSGGYAPSIFRSFPFAMVRIAGKEHPILCVDETSGLITDQHSSGELFFNPEGELAPAVQDVVNFLRQVEQSRIATKRAVDALAAAELIVPRVVKANIDQQEKKIAGLFSVDGKKLDQLDDANFLELRRNGALAVAWGQLLSQGMIPQLQRLDASRQRSALTQEEILNNFNKDDIFKF